MQAEPELGWNQGWQDFVIGLALSFAFVEAITVGILIWANNPAAPVVTPAPTTQLLLFVRILSLVLPFVLIYGMYLAAGTWVYRANIYMRAAGSTGGVIYRKRVTSPYRLGSVMIFGSTIVGVILSNLIGRNAVDDSTRLAGALLRLAIGIACAWLAVYVRRDIQALITGTGADNPSVEADEHE